MAKGIAGLKGGVNTRKNTKEWRSNYDSLKRPCGCPMGKPCLLTCPQEDKVSEEASEEEDGSE